MGRCLLAVAANKTGEAMGSRMALMYDAAWMTPEHFREAAEIDDSAGAWDAADFERAFLSPVDGKPDPAVRGIVLMGGRQSQRMHESKLSAWVVYRFDRESVRILRVCVFRKFRRHGTGDLILRYALANRVDFKAHRGFRFCSASVLETDEPGQWLFRGLGLTCVGVDSNGFRFAGLV